LNSIERIPKRNHFETMVSITIKDIPDEVHALLKERAKESGRSLNRYLVHSLKQMTQPTEVDRKELLNEIRSLRKGSSLRIESTEEVQRAIGEGRA
jgi:plasmid stability protein